jgi:hypothetical protein
MISLVPAGFAISLLFERNRNRSRTLDRVRFGVLLVGTIWLLGLIATGTESGIFIVLLALIIASAAASIGWRLWSGRDTDCRAR